MAGTRCEAEMTYFSWRRDSYHASMSEHARSLRFTGYFLLVLVLYWIYGNRPITAEPWQWADDGLYLRQAEAVQAWWSGSAIQWLGPYDPVLLSKVPLFAVSMAFLGWIGLPLRLGEFVGLLSLPFLFRAAIRPIVCLVGWRFAICTVFLVGLPFLPGEIRLLRTVLQTVASGACLITAIGLITRFERPVGEQAHWALMMGFFFSACYLNREESIWLLPVVGFALFVAAAGAWLNKARTAALIPAFCFALAAAIPIGVVIWLNFTSYGVAFTTDRRAPAMTRAYQLLTSLEPADRQRYVPINTATRLEAYAVSPTLARLQPFLEGVESDSFARSPDHLSLNERPVTDREFFVSDFEFALREGAFRIGNKTAVEMETFFQTVADELTEAIDQKRIASGSRGPAMLAAPLPGDYGRVIASAVISLKSLYLVSGLSVPNTPVSSGDPAGIARIAKITHSAVVPVKDAPVPFNPGPLPEARRAAFAVMAWADSAFYAIGTLLAFAWGVQAIVHWRRPYQLAVSAITAMLACGLVLFCLSMSVVNVLGFPLLKWPEAYNTLGFTPLSILAVYGFVIASCRFDIDHLTRTLISRSHKPNRVDRAA